MKKIFYLLLIITIGGCGNNFSRTQKNESQIKVDSVFKKSFSELRNTLKSNEVMNKDEIIFIYLTDYLSGNPINVQSYSGVPEFDLQSYLRIENWYNKNKNRIKWTSVEQGLQILKSAQITQKEVNELENLKVN